MAGFERNELELLLTFGLILHLLMLHHARALSATLFDQIVVLTPNVTLISAIHKASIQMPIFQAWKGREQSGMITRKKEKKPSVGARG